MRTGTGARRRSVFGTAGLIRAWVAGVCRETPEQMAELAENMILRGSIP